MNVYLIVEGNGEKKVYAHWVRQVNPSLSIVNSLDEVQHNNLIIISGGGYPNYLEVIKAGVEDVSATKQLDRLVISVDSEEMTFHEKWQEIDGVVKALGKKLNYKIIIQHFCLETWALGNKVIVSRNPKNTKIQELRMHFDVLNNDPELLPDYPEDNRNRSQFAEYYLRKLLNEKYRNLSYTKNNPKALLHKKYFHQVKKRWETTRHIKSFKFFLDAFV